MDIGIPFGEAVAYFVTWLMQVIAYAMNGMATSEGAYVNAGTAGPMANAMAVVAHSFMVLWGAVVRAIVS